LLWTDGRYFLQASEQLDAAHWQLMKDRLPETPSIEQWLRAEAGSRSFRVGVDARLFAESECLAMEATWKHSDVHLIAVDENLVDAAWAPNQPPVPRSPLLPLPLQYAGVSVEHKLAALRRALADVRADVVAVSALDEVAWLFNVRAADIEFNPVVIAYALVAADSATLYLHERPADAADAPALAAHLAEARVTTKPYDAFAADVRALAAARKRLWLDPRSTSRATYALVGDAALVVSAPSTIPLAKALKCDAELRGARACHVRDAAAVCQFLAWLERQAAADALPTEIGASDWLDAARARARPTLSRSRSTRSRAPARTAPSSTTRRAPPPTAASAARCTSSTRAASTATARPTSRAPALWRAERARAPLLHARAAGPHRSRRSPSFRPAPPAACSTCWRARRSTRDGLDYRHGTGHGVGAFLNVHEGPHAISFREGSRKQPLLPGMLVTNEPGYYEDGAVWHPHRERARGGAGAHAAQLCRPRLLHVPPHHAGALRAPPHQRRHADAGAARLCQSLPRRVPRRRRAAAAAAERRGAPLAVAQYRTMVKERVREKVKVAK
jgi:Xaa-Pro aminopeptidase